MLNELYQLSESLNHCGLQVEKAHPWIEDKIKKGKGIRVVLNKNSTISNIEYLDPERVSNLWKISSDNQNNFPIINLTGPLFKVSITDDLILLLNGKADKEKQFKILKKAIVSAKFSPSDKIFKSFIRSLVEFPKKLMIESEEPDNKFSAFEELILICSAFSVKEKVSEFLKSLSQILLDSYTDGKFTDISIIISLLCGKWDERKKEITETSNTIFFDIKYGNKDNRYEISSSELRHYYNRYLLQRDEANNKNNNISSIQCILTGRTGKQAIKMPDPNLPVLGPTYLMSMNSDAPCNIRYNKTDSNVFPITEETKNKLNDAIIFITKNERKYKTWVQVPSGEKGKSDLLVVYLEKMPEDSFGITKILGPGSESGDFEAIASSACETLKLKLPEKRDSFIRILLIRSVSKGQKAIRFSDMVTVDNLYEAVEKWIEYSRNIPSFFTYLDLKGKWEKVYPLPPYPLSIFSKMQFQWLNNGLRQKELQGCKLSEIYDLFFYREKQLALYLLGMSLQQSASFLIRFAQAELHNKLNPWGKAFYNYKKDASVLISFLGIVLAINEIKKEDYMKQSGYYVGRLFNFADILHREYCIHVRNKGDGTKSLPPQLLGNALMRNAMDNPEQAISRLQERLMVYKAWADKVHGEQYGIAKWALNQMGQVSESLAKLEIPTKTDDFLKAQILLGYLAREEKNIDNTQGDNK